MENYFDVVVVGGGTSGTAAGIQSARLGVKTLIIEETPWLGGMITSAGVSAFDGNKYALGGGIFGELRKKIEEYYGGPEKTFTGWISLTCFEPKVGRQFLTEMAEKEKDLSIWYECELVDVEKSGKRISSIKIKDKSGEVIKVTGKVFIEATEWGDLLSLADVSYRLGRDSQDDTGEEHAPVKSDFQVQDMTYCAILKKYEGKAIPINPTNDYNPLEFINSTKVHSDISDESTINYKLHDWDSFISYAALPNDKYLLNWPFRSNDYLIDDEIYEKRETRSYHFKKAKERTLNYIHYIQTVLGHPEWGLATNEFPTEDYLPFIPYVRESRRMKGQYLMVEGDVIPVKNSFRPKFIKDSIAVGDYFLDHHHSTFFNPPETRLIENLPANAPFQVPFSSLIPEKTDGLVAAEKSISVSHIVNGCTRLQPVVMLIGQAAGVIAALAASGNISPDMVSVKKVQKLLLESGCQLFPYKDVWNYSAEFILTQELALQGIFNDNKDFTFNGKEIVSIDEIKMLAEKGNLKSIGIEQLEKLSGLSRLEVYKKFFS